MLSISEYQNHGIGKEPVQQRQMIKTGVTASVSEPFNRLTSQVRLASDVDCFVDFGEDPKATSDSLLLLGGTAEYFAVTKGHKLSVVEVA